VTSSGATPSAPQQILFGDSFHGSTLDTVARWDKAETGTASVVVGDGQCLLSTGAGAGTARIKSLPKFALYSGSEILFSCTARRGTAPIDGNDVYIGLEISGSNAFHWNLADTAWKNIAIVGGGGLYERNITSPRIDALNWMNLQIRMTKSRVQFLANKQFIWEYNQIDQQEPVGFGSLCYVWIENTNGSATNDNQLYLSEVSVVRSFENWPAAVQPKRITADTLIARGPCWYLGHKKISGTNAVTIYDNTAGSGTIIDEWTGVTFDKDIPGPIECQTGIYAKLASGSDPSIIYSALA
jgi:hypothetical protein